MSGQLISLLPSEMVQGGLIDDLNVTIKSASFTIFDYQGKAEPRVCLRLELEDEEDGIHEQFYSAADPKHFAPSADGNGIVAVGEKGALNKGSNFEQFMVSLINAGFPEAKLREGATGMVGTKVHVVRKAQPQRGGIIRQEGQGQATILLVDQVLELPGEGKKGAAKTSKANVPVANKPAAKASAPAAASTDNGVDDDLRAIVMEALEAKPEGYAPKGLVPVVFKKATGPNKKAMTARVVQEEFLAAGAEEGLWQFDGETVTPA